MSGKVRGGIMMAEEIKKDVNNEEKENSSSSYEYMKLTYAYDKGEYYLVNVSDLEDYFSRY